MKFDKSKFGLYVRIEIAVLGIRYSVCNIQSAAYIEQAALHDSTSLVSWSLQQGKMKCSYVKTTARVPTWPLTMSAYVWWL